MDSVMRSNGFLYDRESGGFFANHCYAFLPRLSGMKALTDPFSAHPRSVGETYWQHLGVSLSFSGSLLLAASAALVHGLFPFLFVRTGSSIISRLHEKMVLHRLRTATRDQRAP